MVEGARLESVYTSKAYREFESLRLRQNKCDHPNKCWDFSFLEVAEITPKVLVKQAQKWKSRSEAE